MSCSLHTIPLRADAARAAARMGIFLKAAQGFSDSSGWFTFHMDWTGEGRAGGGAGGGEAEEKCTIV